MAGLFDKQAAMYLEARPNYPSEWFSMLAALTPHHSLAWDAGTGNGQAAVGVAQHYDRVIATDVSEEQLKHATQHPKIRYAHTPLSMSDDEIVALIGGENSVDLLTVATAVHWFDLEKFYCLAKRLLRKPGGVIALWTYVLVQVSPEFDAVLNQFRERVLPFRDPKTQYALDGYKTLPFPFESVGLGSNGHPRELEMTKECSFQGFVGLLGSLSSVSKAKEQGIDLLSEEFVKELESAWGGPQMVRTITYKAYMLAGKVL
uniref:Methyltransferase type 11 domain-containing protein n=1 Tax=Rhizophora mucronata TaxID=61149 RepID=A0A2P2K4F9_RHIMU